MLSCQGTVGSGNSVGEINVNIRWKEMQGRHEIIAGLLILKRKKKIDF